MCHHKIHSYGGCLNNRKEPEMQEDRRWPPIAQRRARFVPRPHFIYSFINRGLFLEKSKF